MKKIIDRITGSLKTLVAAIGGTIIIVMGFLVMAQGFPGCLPGTPTPLGDVVKIVQAISGPTKSSAPSPSTSTAPATSTSSAADGNDQTVIEDALRDLGAADLADSTVRKKMSERLMQDIGLSREEADYAVEYARSADAIDSAAEDLKPIVSRWPAWTKQDRQEWNEAAATILTVHTRWRDRPPPSAWPNDIVRQTHVPWQTALAHLAEASRLLTASAKDDNAAAYEEAIDEWNTGVSILNEMRRTNQGGLFGH